MTDEYDRYAIPRFTRKNKSRDGVLTAYKQQVMNTHKRKDNQSYCVLCNNNEIPDHKYKLNSSKNCFVCRSDQDSIKEGLGGSMGNSNDAVKKLWEPENNWKREMK